MSCNVVLTALAPETEDITTLQVAKSVASEDGCYLIQLRIPTLHLFDSKDIAPSSMNSLMTFPKVARDWAWFHLRGLAKLGLLTCLFPSGNGCIRFLRLP